MILVVAPAALLFWTTSAHSLNRLETIEWMCNNTGESLIHDELLSVCQMKEDREPFQSACDIRTGTPFACYDKDLSDPELYECRVNHAELDVTGDTGSSFGWAVEGEVHLTTTMAYRVEGYQKCGLVPKEPEPESGAGGIWVRRSGTAWAGGYVVVSGEGKLTFLGGTVLTKSKDKQCLRNYRVRGYENGSNIGCGES